MIVTVLPVPHPESRAQLRNSTSVVIDVLRASNTILEALNNGAKEVIPVTEPEQVIKLKLQYPSGHVVLSGERMGLKIEGFDVGNSPFEFTPKVVSGKIIIMCSTNGTKTITYASIAESLLIGTFRNMDAVVAKLIACPTDIYLIGSGKFGQFCLEDMVCAGGIVEQLISVRKDLLLTDSALAAAILYNYYKRDILKMFHICEHGEYLCSLGFEEDLKFCSQLNVSNRVPELHNGILQ